ncbi:hypothetical protein [Ponticaulis sp.]|uniref:hypothetical protein n=1 Tax=Ponticaulis sp. TaxID=2020902 RepID=UPI000B7236CE|nr:hypothetical protein [Ponticaulis sp.]MAI90755.1 hypothetical protein [Ponticaulis sp.]OUX98982.1 MAG: hypothetical protein CBB65_09965 [Hyphomonadaceae bacterium TMED5]|tara:strand:- start:40741 stop:40938 length:198 start_codon:yes stop_codon:yes gene_type:complete
MVEVLVILRDAILATVLSWIGVDYEAPRTEPAENQHAMKFNQEQQTATVLLSGQSGDIFFIGTEA